MDGLESIKKSQNVSVTAIVCAFNEESRVKSVLRALEECSLVDHIIVVEDGSSDNTSEKIREISKKSSKIKPVFNKENRGKAFCFKKALQSTDSDIILTVDADLKGLQEKHISMMLLPVIQKTYDMTVLLIGRNKIFMNGTFGFAHIFSGQRAFWRKDIDPKSIPMNYRFSLEALINSIMIKKNKQILSFTGYEIWDRPTSSLGKPASIFKNFKADELYKQFLHLDQLIQEPLKTPEISDLSEENIHKNIRKPRNSWLRRQFFKIYTKACIILNDL